MNLFKTAQHPIRAAFATLAVAAIPATAVAVPTEASALPTERSAACATGWGSLPDATTMGATANLTDVRTGRHACFDRLVVDIAG